MMILDNPMLKTKEFEVQEKYTMLKNSDSLQVIEITAVTPSIPYGDCFSTQTRFCITQVSENACHLIISNEVVFQKSTLLRSLIKSNAVKGLLEKSNQILNLLETRYPPQSTSGHVKAPQTIPATGQEKETGRINNIFYITSIFVAFILGFSLTFFMKHTEQIHGGINWLTELTIPGNQVPSKRYVSISLM